MPFPSPLLPPMTDEERKGLKYQNWIWESIISSKVQEAAKTSLTEKNHPFSKYLPRGWHQGDRGTCVGHACAIMMQCNYYALTGDIPTPDEMKESIPDQVIDLNTCKVIYDRWYRTVFSAQWCYLTSRKVGNVTVPSGSYCSAAIDAMKSVGAVQWDQCITSKTPYCAPETYPHDYDRTATLAKDHKIDGYAQITSWKGLMDAIATEPAHCVIMPINVYDIPPDGMGNLRISGDPSGSHALPWCFVDYEQSRIGCWNSWGPDYPQITWINERYWREAAGPAFSPLDHEEVVIGLIFNTLVTVKSNIPCEFWVNGEKRPESPTQQFSLMLQSVFEHEITAIPVDTSYQKQTKKCSFHEVRETVEFIFQKEPEPKPKDLWFEKIFNKLREIWEMIHRMMVIPKIQLYTILPEGETTR